LYSSSNIDCRGTPRASERRERWRSEGLRVPCSMPHMYVRCMPASSARRSCDHPRAVRSARTRLPSDFATRSVFRVTRRIFLGLPTCHYDRLKVVTLEITFLLSSTTHQTKTRASVSAGTRQNRVLLRCRRTVELEENPASFCCSPRSPGGVMDGVHADAAAGTTSAHDH